MTEVKVSKLDAARRQLETAVRLYFAEADPVAIHSLTAAAHRLLSDVNKYRGGGPMLLETVLKLVLPDKVAVVKRHLNAAANFFKHAAQDPGDVYTFNPAQTEFMLLDACSKYKDLTGELVPILAVYSLWFWLGPGAKYVDVTRMKTIDRFRKAFVGQNRGSFFRETLPIVSDMNL
jgi:hypothetical protein